MNNSEIVKYCTGCGACVSEGKAAFIVNKDGFKVPSPRSDDFNRYCNSACFSSGCQYRNYHGKINIWGTILSSHYAYATNPSVRLSGSSGGCLTALCVYLLKSGKIDGVVHVMENPQNPIETTTVISYNENEVISRNGSRYSSSSPLIEITKYVHTNKKYCFVGKPCDVATLRNLMEQDIKYKEVFIYLFSFFCAGAPSIHANELLLKKMGTELHKVKKLRYRGDGWPGYATAIDKDGQKHKLYYRTAWRDTLGRDIRPICRFCIDGIGEMADIVCFDAWFMDAEKRPMFEEADGRNGVFCRTNKGEQVYSEAVKSGYVSSSDYSRYDDELRHIQKYQYTRRSTMPVTLLAMKLFFKSVPSYPSFFMLPLMQQCSWRITVSRFIGTIKRILKGRIQ